MRAFSKPLSNIGVLLDETSKRALRTLGYVTSAKLHGVHPALQGEADDIAIVSSTEEPLERKCAVPNIYPS